VFSIITITISNTVILTTSNLAITSISGYCFWIY